MSISGLTPTAESGRVPLRVARSIKHAFPPKKAVQDVPAGATAPRAASPAAGMRISCASFDWRRRNYPSSRKRTTTEFYRQTDRDRGSSLVSGDSPPVRNDPCAMRRIPRGAVHDPNFGVGLLLNLNSHRSHNSLFVFGGTFYDWHSLMFYDGCGSGLTVPRGTRDTSCALFGLA